MAVEEQSVLIPINEEHQLVYNGRSLKTAEDGRGNRLTFEGLTQLSITGILSRDVSIGMWICMRAKHIHGLKRKDTWFARS